MMFTTGIAHRIDHHLLKPARRKISATGAKTIGEMIATMTVPRSQLKRLNEPISGSLSLSHDKRTVTTRFPIFDHPHHVSEIPKLCCNASRRRRGHPKALVNSYEIVVHEVDRDRVSVVLDLLRERRPGAATTAQLR
jgi:hypothetical protein